MTEILESLAHLETLPIGECGVNSKNVEMGDIMYVGDDGGNWVPVFPSCLTNLGDDLYLVYTDRMNSDRSHLISLRNIAAYKPFAGKL